MYIYKIYIEEAFDVFLIPCDFWPHPFRWKRCYYEIISVRPFVRLARCRFRIAAAKTPFHSKSNLLEWGSYQIRKIVGCAYAGNTGNGFPAIGITNPRCRGKRSRHPGACATRNFACLVRGPLGQKIDSRTSMTPYINSRRVDSTPIKFIGIFRDRRCAISLGQLDIGAPYDRAPHLENAATQKFPGRFTPN